MISASRRALGIKASANCSEALRSQEEMFMLLIILQSQRIDQPGGVMSYVM